MSLWDDLPAGIRGGGGADALRPVLDSVETPVATEESDTDGSWRVYRTSIGDDDPLSLDPATGRFRRAAGSGSTPIEFPDPRVTIVLRLRLDAPGGSPDGRVQLIVGTPRAIVRLPFLRGARLDAQGQLREDPVQRDVRFHVPAIRVRVERQTDGELAVTLLSASTTGGDVDEIFEFVRMEPPHALIGPGNVVGFAFRTASLDLSGTSGPTGVPPGALALPAAWQGFHLPEARLFVAPSGLEGLAVSGGVRDLWIGIGEHAGVTGVFEGEVVDRGRSPTVRLRFQTPAGEWIGVPDDGPLAPVELPDRSRLYVDAAGGLAPHTIEITVDGVTTTSDRVDVVTPAAGTVAITVTVGDAGAHTTTRSISARRRTVTGGATSAPGGADGVVLTEPSPGFGRIVVVSQSATSVTLAVEPPSAGIAWSWSGGGAASGPTATVTIPSGSTVAVVATRTLATEISCYTQFDRPPHRSNPVQVEAWAANADNTRTEPAGARDAWAGGRSFVDAASLARFDDYPAGTTWTVDGYASYEGHDDTPTVDRNDALSERRRDAMVHLLRSRTTVPAGSVVRGTAHGHGPASTSTEHPPGAASWWRATATASLPGGTPPDETITVDVTRPALPPPVPDVDPPPARPPVPDCFRKLGFRVELIRGTFVRAEVYGEFDVRTAAEQRLAANAAAPLPPRTNPSDGISTFLVRLRIAEDRTSWDVAAEFRAVDADVDGLAAIEANATGDNTGVDVLGAIATLAPLLAAVTPPSPRDGELVPVVVATAAAIGIGASGVMTTRHVILRGGRLLVTDGVVDPTTGSGPTTTQVSVLLDVETAFTFDLGFIRVRPDRPITTRYRAVGVRSSWSSAPQPDGSVEYLPLPVFDPNAGYALDVPTGSLVAAEPLGDVLRILGVRTSRDNPTYLEVEVGMGVDLGILTVDTARVRLRLDQLEPPQLTKLGATLEIAGTLRGSGVVEITDAGFKGSFDLAITALGLRASASLAVESRDGVTGVLVGVDVEFPLPIVLGNSGLGIYGFMGGVGVNYRRNEPTGVPAPALRWLEAQLARPGGVMDPTGWTHSAGAMAVAGGMLVGTVEGGFVLHLKGIVLIELPGPRLLLVMKADVLKLPPALDSTQSATFLAVLDIDFGRGTITIGVVAEYRIARLLEIRVPVTAFFATDDPGAWFVDLGSFTEPVTVKVLDVISGSGYLMVHGNGIAGLPVPVVTSGLTIATGFHFSAVLMGSKSVGLYFEVAAGFDAVVSFEPFAIGGRIYARGELRLFIVSIGASAELTVLVGRQLVGTTEVDRTYIHGEVCGKVDFFFFSVKGCVALTIGEQPPQVPPPPDLVKGVVLVGRSPALLEGTAIDRTVDGKLADAIAAGDTDPLPTVPLDAIPVVLFAAPTDHAPGNIVLGGEARGSTGLPSNPWIQRGDRWWRYRVTAVDLVGPLEPADGATPATWWARGLPGDTSHGPALALLDWLPTPTPRAITYGETLTTQIRERWGTICREPAAPAPVLWTFDRRPRGPSPVGWRLDGVPWPDDADTHRSSPVEATLHVDEPWRSGDPDIDVVHGTDPAVVIGDAVPCAGRDDIRRVEDLDAWTSGNPLTFSEAAPRLDADGLADLGATIVSGTSLNDALAVHASSAWDPVLVGRDRLTCDGRILRSPDADAMLPAGGGPVDADVVAEGWAATRHEPSDLENAIRLHQAGGFAALGLLLLLPRESPRELLVRSRDRDGNVVGEEPVTPTHAVSAAHPVPLEWTDPDGPWADPVGRAGRIAARVAGAGKRLRLYYIDLDGARGAESVEIGWPRESQERSTAPAFHLVAAAGLTATETARHDWDSTQITRERDLIETTLTQDPDDHALFVPDRTYTVRVSWQATSLRRDTQPSATEPVDWSAIGVETQEFGFRADPQTEAPTDLAPWLLATTPAPDETGLFCREPVLIALATQNVSRLLAAYGEELRVIVHASSGRHPAPPGGVAGGHLTIPTSPGGLLQPIVSALAVMSPWEQAVSELVADRDLLPCIPADVDRTHHHVLTISYDFEPRTDYLLDIVAVPTGAGAGSTGRRVHRLGFSTGGFDTVDDLARMIARGELVDTYVDEPIHVTGLPERPSGAELDSAFQRAGLGVPEPRRFPRIEVLWSGDEPPQPVAVIVESSEPLWRERPMPTQVVDSSTTQTPPPTWWAARPTPWLRPEASTAPPVPGDPPRATVTRLIRAPGDARAVFVLAAGSRGAELLVDLVVPASTLYGAPERRARLFGTVLRTAPWEEG